MTNFRIQWSDGRNVHDRLMEANDEYESLKLLVNEFGDDFYVPHPEIGGTNMVITEIQYEHLHLIAKIDKYQLFEKIVDDQTRIKCEDLISSRIEFLLLVPRKELQNKIIP